MSLPLMSLCSGEETQVIARKYISKRIVSGTDEYSEEHDKVIERHGHGGQERPCCGGDIGGGFWMMKMKQPYSGGRALQREIHNELER